MLTANKQTLKQMTLDTKFGTVTFSYNIQASARAKHMRLNFDYITHEVKVTIPDRCSTQDAYAFIKEQKNWIAKRVSKERPNVSLYEHMKAYPFVNINGKRCQVQIDQEDTHPQIFWNDDRDHVHAIIHPDVCANIQLSDVFLGLAKKALLLRSYDLTDRIGIYMPRIGVRNQKSLWGSCSSLGAISLNWRLILIDQELQDHVIFHEFAHLKHLNHSRAFWDLLEKYSPNTHHHEHLLNKLSLTIMPLGQPQL